MAALLSVREVAEYLGLNPQTVYRKVKRGEFDAVRFGKTVRIRLPDDREKVTPPSPPRPVPEFIHRLLWDLEPSTIFDDSSQVLERVLEHGDLGDVAWLFRVQTHDKIVAFLRSKGKRRLSPRSYRFWCDYFEIKNEEDYSQPRPKTALGEGRWR